jgi:[ribosomal protein S5]-alanine N-acetyltransferase
MGDKNFTPFPVLKTERLTLRQLLSTDANEIFALRSNESVNKYLNRKPSQSIDDANTFIQAINNNIQSNNSIYWAITLSDNDKLIGTICLFDFSDDNVKAEIGYELLPNFQGKGIMQEAAKKIIDYAIKHMGLQCLEAYTHIENQSSTKLLEKNNFKQMSVEGDIMMFKMSCEE